MPVLGNIESGIPFLFPLSLGATFGRAYQYANFLSPMALLGDPTLRVRQAPQPPSAFRLSQVEIDFGEVPVVEMEDGALPLGGPVGPGSLEIEATNVGRGTLVVNPVPSYVHFLYEGQWPDRLDNPISFIFPDQIAPGGRSVLRFGLSPSRPGEYTGFVAFYTNDPDRSLVIVPFRGTAWGKADATDAPRDAPPPPVEECGGTADILRLEVPESARANERVHILLYVTPASGLRHMEVHLVLPEGVTLLDGELLWTGELSASDLWQREVVVSAARPGTYAIQGRFQGSTVEGTSDSDCKELFLHVQ